MRLRSIIKQLKDKGIRAKCRFPAQLRIEMENGTKIFPTLLDVIPTLEKLNITIQISEREKMETELSRETWMKKTSNKRNGKEGLHDADLKVYI